MSTAIAPSPTASTTVVPPRGAAPSVVPPARAAVETGTSAYASIAHGTTRGYYRVLFESGPVDAAVFAGLAGVSVRESRRWLSEQCDLGLLRPVSGASAVGSESEVYLPGEFVPILVDGRGLIGFDGARRMFEARVDSLPDVLRSLWAESEDPVGDLSRGIGRLWSRMLAATR